MCKFVLVLIAVGFMGSLSVYADSASVLGSGSFRGCIEELNSNVQIVLENAAKADASNQCAVLGYSGTTHQSSAFIPTKNTKWGYSGCRLLIQYSVSARFNCEP